MEERPVRKSVRLKEYDYSAPGAYFLTICTQIRRCILSNIIMEPQTGAVGALHEAPLQEDHKRSVLSKAIGYLKANSSKEIHRFRPGEDIWQRAYYDHVVRNEDDLRQIVEYIESNPAR